MEFMADEARKALSEIPTRRPKRLSGYQKLRAFGDGHRLRGTILWLHELHGDPVKGKTKREARQELGFGRHEDEKLVAAAQNMELEIEVTVDDVAHRGMPLTYLEALSDVEFTASSQAVQVNVVVVRWEIQGTHGAGALFGVPPTGKRVSFSGITWVAFEETRNPDRSANVRGTDEWTYWDLPSLMQQIGASP
jgi:predicted ester cyclase